jgi:signal transduction histidine kinase
MRLLGITLDGPGRRLLVLTLLLLIASIAGLFLIIGANAPLWLAIAAIMLNLILTLLIARLVFAQLRQLADLATHLQDGSEREKQALSRELHDELGGLLVSARMDLSWIERQLPASDPAVTLRFKRISDALTAGVNLKRRVVEELRPTLLDNMGLFAALRWQVKEACARTGLACTQQYPDEEIQLLPHASIAIFRTVQEALRNIGKHAAASSIDVAVDVIEGELVLHISDNGCGLSVERLRSFGHQGLAIMRHRIDALGGYFDVRNLNGGGTQLAARIPLKQIEAVPG